VISVRTKETKMQTRQTSIEAYNKIKENGLLSQRRFEVYDYVFGNGPTTARGAVKALSKKRGEQVAISFSSYAARFSELRDVGVLAEVGTTIDKDTGCEVILWDVTDRLPIKLDKPKRIKCKACNGKGYFETQQGKLF
jgi:hypothetical protein